jgi:hypothetical protein
MLVDQASSNLKAHLQRQINNAITKCLQGIHISQQDQMQKSTLKKLAANR